MWAPASRSGRVGLGVAIALSASLLLFFLLPLVYLFWYVGWGGLAAAVSNAGFVVSIEFTLFASGIAVGLGLLGGIPLGYLLARYRFRGRSIVESVVLLPVVIPHLIVGIALLLLLAPTGPLGPLVTDSGLRVFDGIWGVVLVMVYVGASYVVLSSQLAFRAIDSDVIEASRAHGATPGEVFATVTLPQAARGILTGSLLMWARGVSEVGGFLILAYAVYPGSPWFGPVTNPASVYIYNLYGISGLEGAASASCLLVLVALAIFVAVRLIDRAGLYTPRGGWFS